MENRRWRMDQEQPSGSDSILHPRSSLPIFHTAFSLHIVPSMDAAAILDGLTDAQKEAVTHVDGPLLIIAGAGSGKTRVITRRVAYLIGLGIPPPSILRSRSPTKPPAR